MTRAHTRRSRTCWPVWKNASCASRLSRLTSRGSSSVTSSWSKSRAWPPIGVSTSSARWGWRRRCATGGGSRLPPSSWASSDSSRASTQRGPARRVTGSPKPATRMSATRSSRRRGRISIPRGSAPNCSAATKDFRPTSLRALGPRRSGCADGSSASPPAKTAAPLSRPRCRADLVPTCRRIRQDDARASFSRSGPFVRSHLVGRRGSPHVWLVSRPHSSE